MSIATFKYYNMEKLFTKQIMSVNNLTAAITQVRILVITTRIRHIMILKVLYFTILNEEVPLLDFDKIF